MVWNYQSNEQNQRDQNLWFAEDKNMENMLPMTVEFKDGFEVDLPLPPANAKVPMP